MHSPQLFYYPEMSLENYIAKENYFENTYCELLKTILNLIPLMIFIAMQNALLTTVERFMHGVLPSCRLLRLYSGTL